MEEKEVLFIRSLPEKQRAILLLRVIGQFSFDEIERITGTKKSTARSTYQQASKKLTDSLGWGWDSKYTNNSKSPAKNKCQKC